MKVEDVVKGKRVKVIADSDNLIPIGATGTLIESHSLAPYVNFDKHYEGSITHDNYENVYSMWSKELEEI